LINIQFWQAFLETILSTHRNESSERVKTTFKIYLAMERFRVILLSRFPSRIRRDMQGIKNLCPLGRRRCITAYGFLWSRNGGNKINVGHGNGSLQRDIIYERR